MIQRGIDPFGHGINPFEKIKQRKEKPMPGFVNQTPEEPHERMIDGIPAPLSQPIGQTPKLQGITPQPQPQSTPQPQTTTHPLQQGIDLLMGRQGIIPQSGTLFTPQAMEEYGQMMTLKDPEIQRQEDEALIEKFDPYEHKSIEDPAAYDILPEDDPERERQALASFDVDEDKVNALVNEKTQELQLMAETLLTAVNDFARLKAEGQETPEETENQKFYRQKIEAMAELQTKIDDLRDEREDARSGIKDAAAGGANTGTLAMYVRTRQMAYDEKIKKYQKELDTYRNEIAFYNKYGPGAQTQQQRQTQIIQDEQGRHVLVDKQTGGIQYLTDPNTGQPITKGQKEETHALTGKKEVDARGYVYRYDNEGNLVPVEIGGRHFQQGIPESRQAPENKAIREEKEWSARLHSWITTGVFRDDVSKWHGIVEDDVQALFSKGDDVLRKDMTKVLGFDPFASAVDFDEAAALRYLEYKAKNEPNDPIYTNLIRKAALKAGRQKNNPLT